jgi:hypothetical protein
MIRSTSYTYWTGILMMFICMMSCKGLQKEVIIYQNSFESDSLQDIINGKIESYNGSKVLGRYSENGFVLRLENMRPHDMIQVSFDLYIHDTWDGNSKGADGPDIWIMNIDNYSAFYSTFASGQCDTCTQSFPVAIPPIVNNKPVFYINKPNSNAIKTDLPGACKLKDVKGGTSLYKIVRTFSHTAPNIDIGCFAQLEDPDAANKNCNESWSVDNIKVKAIIFK